MKTKSVALALAVLLLLLTADVAVAGSFGCLREDLHLMVEPL